MSYSIIRRTAALASASLTAFCATGALAQEVEIYQPGAPGAQGRVLDAETAARLADTRYSPDDVAFLQGMIHHHWQAVEMARLVADRTNAPALREAAGRIEKSQEDEIAFMRRWLAERGEDAPLPGDSHAEGHAHMAHRTMKGMASAAEMAELAALSGVAFDRKFLTLMIAHHEGALDMVRDLLRKEGTAFDPALYDFTSDVKNDQSAEIKTMLALLAGLSPDPRSGLAAGLTDAGEAIENMVLLASLPRPAGFFDPANPGDLKPEKPREDDKAADSDGEAREPEFGTRSPWLDFSNTDIAFSGDTLVLGNYHGFNIYKLDADGLPTLYSSVVCPGGQGDVSIVENLLITSVEQNRGRKDCGLQGIDEDVSAERHRGLRIFDISDLRRPRQVGLVQTCRGSHTHSVVSADDTAIVVYNSGTSSVREEEELAGCIGDIAGDERTALFSIDVIEIPRADPSQARIIDSPRVFARDGVIAGLWRGGDHGEGTQTTDTTDQCHDITVFPAKDIAAGACSGNGIILDISDPRNPTRIDDVTEKGFAYWHSATFNNDGTKVLFTDEWGGGGQPRCRASDPLDWGANAIYDIVDGELEYRSTFKIPAPQSDKENCVAHNGSIVPFPGRDILVQAWYQGGISLIDFTDSANPVEIGYFDRGPIDADQLTLGGYWSVYFYKGRIYGSEITRGLDVFALAPSDYLSANEIAAAALADQGETFNPQTQTQVSWPAEPVVARAILDQWAREGTTPRDGKALVAMLDAAETALAAGGTDAALAARIRAYADAMGETHGRATILHDTLEGIANRLA